jgi:Xaa-Pro aminopeptidase
LGTNPVILAKALKNETEREGFRQCHIRDGAALCKFFAWLQHELTVKNNKNLNEVSVADKLEGFRSQQDLFMGLSFATISGSGPNGAIIHYHPKSETASLLSTDLIYLCDSGGQYKDGTTDVTRTLHFGTPTEHQRRTYTRVLQGHLALGSARFPEGTFGHQLDVLARIPLWSEGLNYRHGTGHGVGHFLNVHEGPHGIGTRSTTVALQPSMTVTNEPGYYEDGEFGIRIENVMIVKEAKTLFNFGGSKYLEFETVTMAPYQNKMIDVSILSASEISWVNRYHQEVFDKVSPLLQDDSLAREWLYNETRPL